jgi:DNA replication initiation complex subunit (GINS family)
MIKRERISFYKRLKKFIKELKKVEDPHEDDLKRDVSMNAKLPKVIWRRNIE